jgi:hypothetical protein
VIGNAAALSIVAAAGCIGAASCAGPKSCAGQCAPPYELLVNFRARTLPVQAEHVLHSCVANNPVVLRVGEVQRAGSGSRALIYTRVVGNTKRTAGLVTCLRLSGVTHGVGWPD